MKKLFRSLAAVAMLAGFPLAASAAIEGSLDPQSVVEQWSTESTQPLVFDINFSDTSWPDTWTKETGRDCPEWTDGGYVNAILNTRVNPDRQIEYPVTFHNCVFANKKSYNGFAGATAAFSRQYYLGEKATGNSAAYMNNWTVPGHTYYLEDNITLDSKDRPAYGEAGFVQMCRNAAITDESGNQVSLHGWMEIDHIPYVERVQWSWSSTSWGRGIKCDYKIGDGDWQPLVWMGSERQKQGWTSFSDQGYFMENVINASDVSLRWRVWDGEDFDNPVQTDATGACPFNQAIDPMAQRQAPRVHKIRIFGTEITQVQADFARENPVADPGELSDLGNFGFTGGEEAPDTDAPVVKYVVNPDGSADFTTVQAAIDAVKAGERGIIYIMPGTYNENLYAGRKGEPAKFISLIGADPETTILTSSTHREGNDKTYLDCSALNVFSPCFYAENLTISNTSGSVGRAEALFTNGDAHIFKNCRILGFQDTYKANVGNRGYFYNCLIEGATDFIYDGGLEWFESCQINSIPGGSYIAAPAESMMPMSKVLYPELSADAFYPGLFFSNCNLTAADGVAAGSVYLGRPWQETSGAMYIACRLGSHINAAGWKGWNGAEATSSLYEYRDMNADGTAADVSARASFSRQATDAEYEAYINPAFLFGKASKVDFDPVTTIKGVAAPSSFTFTSTGFSWEASPEAVAYIIYNNGKFEAFTDKAEYAVPESASTAAYSVCAVSRRGVTSAASEVKEDETLLAFPSAEGFGKYATGGRGGKVVKVTSLADDGSAGTLRWAFNQYKGEPITIVFEVSGNIVLNSELRVNRADWTLAGQTAPGAGILISHAKVNLGGSQNFIVRNVRFRIGQKSVDGNVMCDNALGAENCANYIFDHCSFGWSVEENMNTADCHFLTVQYCMVHEGLYNAGHSKGVRGYGTQWGGSPATYHHNLLAHNQSRSPRFNGARGEDHVVFMEYINNVNYNYGKEGGCYGGENTAPVSSYNGLNSAHECNFINNYYKPGPASSTSTLTFFNSSLKRDGATSWGPAKWYVDGNIAHGFDAITADNWKGVKVEGYKLDEIRSNERIVTATPYYKYTIAGPIGSYIPERYMMYQFESAADAFNTVVDHAGTINRDAVEQRIAREAREGSVTYSGAAMGQGKGIIDTENDAEGFYEYPADYTVPADADADGMADAWETSVGLDPAVADNNRLNPDGYTALEVYLASLMGENMSTNFDGSGIAEIVALPQMAYDSASETLSVPAEASGAVLAAYATDGTLVYRTVVTSTAVDLSKLPAGVAILRLSGRHTATRTLKIIR